MSEMKYIVAVLVTEETRLTKCRELSHNLVIHTKAWFSMYVGTQACAAGSLPGHFLLAAQRERPPPQCGRGVPSHPLMSSVQVLAAAPQGRFPPPVCWTASQLPCKTHPEKEM